MIENILKNIDINSEWFINNRRELHKIPELDFDLPKTTKYITTILDELGVNYKTNIGKSGIVADFIGKDTTKTIALRADIDALPILESSDCPFKSEHIGKMHSCGHDVHCSVLLGVVKVLSTIKEELPCNVRLIFQPAEETTGGALPMINDGVLDNVDAIFGLHVHPSLHVGKIGVKYGPMFAASTTVNIKIIGKSTHGAFPSDGVDAIVTACQVVNSIQSIVSRNTDSRDSLVITFGTINGGTKENIVANEVTLTGTIRTLSQDMRVFAKTRIKEMAEFVAKGYGASAEVNFRDSYDALINHDSFVDIIKSSGEELLSKENVINIPKSEMGAEDFAYYLEKVPGAFFLLGTGNEELNACEPLHNDKFKIDETSIPLGIKMQVLNIFKAYEFLKNR